MDTEYEALAEKLANAMLNDFKKNSLDRVLDLNTDKDGIEDFEECSRVERYAITLFAIRLLEELHLNH